MKKYGVRAAAAVAAFVSIPHAALALNASSFVASSGLDSNPCTRAAPCATFQHAHDVTTGGGDIGVIDPGDYGGVTITKPISIIATSLPTGITPGGTVVPLPNITINAGPSDFVLLRGLNIGGAHLAPSEGILFNSGAQLQIHDCIVKNWDASAGQAGITFKPSTASYLVITDTVVSNNKNASSGSGILVKPSGSGSARVSLERVTVEGNGFGIAIDGSGSTAGINVTIADSVSTGNINDGIIATTSAGGAPIGVTLTSTRSTNNGFGLRSIGSNVTVRADRSTIIGNGTGLTAAGGGALLSAGNNVVEANATNGAFSGAITLK
jgi:hypothetical protein